MSLCVVPTLVATPTQGKGPEINPLIPQVLDYGILYIEECDLVLFPDPPVLRRKEGLVYKVGILGCADSAVVGKLHNNHVMWSVPA